MYAVKTYHKAVHFYMRKVSYKNVSTRGQAHKLFCFLTRLISCKIFFPRWTSDRFVILHEIDLVKKYMDLFLCEIDLVQKQNFTISGLTAKSGAYTQDSSRQNCEINLVQKQTFTISGLTAESGRLHTRFILAKCHPLLHEEKHRTKYFLYEDDIVQ